MLFLQYYNKSVNMVYIMDSNGKSFDGRGILMSQFAIQGVLPCVIIDSDLEDGKWPTP
jgi:hypothetical protein